MTPDLYWLTLSAIATMLMAFPYVLEAIGRLGLTAAAGYSSDKTSGGFERPSETPAAWASRAYRAHRNAVESFGVLAALVLTAHFMNAGGGLVAQAAQAYFFARLAHYVVYTAGIPYLRTAAFFACWGSLAVIAYAVMTGG